MANQRCQAEFKLQTSGTVPAGAQLRINFPEIPYQLSLPLKEVHQVDFQAARLPGYCLLTLEDGSKVLAEARVEPVGTSQEVQLHIR